MYISSAIFFSARRFLFLASRNLPLSVLRFTSSSVTWILTFFLREFFLLIPAFFRCRMLLCIVLLLWCFSDRFVRCCVAVAASCVLRAGGGLLFAVVHDELLRWLSCMERKSGASVRLDKISTSANHPAHCQSLQPSIFPGAQNDYCNNTYRTFNSVRAG